MNQKQDKHNEPLTMSNNNITVSTTMPIQRKLVSRESIQSRESNGNTRKSLLSVQSQRIVDNLYDVYGKSKDKDFKKFDNKNFRIIDEKFIKEKEEKDEEKKLKDLKNNTNNINQSKNITNKPSTARLNKREPRSETNRQDTEDYVNFIHY